MHRKMFVFVVMFVALIFSAESFAVKKKIKVTKAKKVYVKKEVKNNEPVVHPPISKNVVDVLASGNLNGAIIAMREEPASPKLLYLTREVTRIVNFEMQEKQNKDDLHKVYQNVAIAYHNLYLFLKSKGFEQKYFLKEAERYYKKAKNKATASHKLECDLLNAFLIAMSGDVAKAQKKFSKIDVLMLRGDFASEEYLAAYYASVGDTVNAISSLEAAYKINPDATLTWLAVGDDFSKISIEPDFQALLISWKAKDVEEKMYKLSVPKAAKPRLEVTDETGIFRPQMTMPHYKLKKGKIKKSSTKKSITKNKPR